MTNGLGFLFKTEITLASDSKCTVQIISFEKKEESKFKLHLAVAPTKMNDRFEWFLEKATEIGIHEITPIICDRSERKVINAERFDKIILSAMKQSNELFLPKLNNAVTFKEFIKQQNKGLQLIAHCEEAARSAGLTSIRLYTNEKMAENLMIYPRLGYIETGRRSEHGFNRVYFEKRLA